MAKAGIPIAAVTSPGAQMGDALTVSGTSSPRPHLDGPVECWPPPAQHEQTQNGDAIAEVVDEGHVVDERVRVSHKHDDCRGPALGEDWAEGWPSTCLRSALPAQARRLLSPGPAHSHCGRPSRTRAHPCHYPHCWGAQLPTLPARVPQLTQTRRAGIGVQRLTWIMASRLGRCPSRAPEKHSLQGEDRDGWGLRVWPWVSPQPEHGPQL